VLHSSNGFKVNAWYANNGVIRCLVTKILLGEKVYILGYSGIHNAIQFREDNLSALTRNEYRICQGMDSAAALLHDGEIIAAAAQERFNGETHTCQFPYEAIQFCLQQADISIEQVNAICHGFNYDEFQSLFTLEPYTKKCYSHLLSQQAQISLFKRYFDLEKVENIFFPKRHHDAHAASSYFTSSFNEAMVFVADGSGELDSISIYHAKNGQLNAVARQNLLSSLGMLYALFTMQLGFSPNQDEYKVMGLAPYGDPERFRHFFKNCINLLPEGKIHIPMLEKNQTLIDKQTYRATRQWIENALIKERLPEEPILQIHKDIAAGLQDALEYAIEHIISYWQQTLNVDNLCMAGGVSLNCTANGKLINQGLFKNIYVQPATGDDGTALGAALLHYYMTEKNTYTPVKKPPLPFYGPSFTNDEIFHELKKHDGIKYTYLDEAALIDTTAKSLADEKIVAWMQGRMEFGPRALGNRSVLASPLNADMRDKINLVVKKRESFRPFAPSVIAEAATTYFDVPERLELPHMLFVIKVREKYKDKIPAVVHVNDTSRIQTVNQKNHTLYWKLLKRFEYYTDIPVLLNTSFNLSKQPIVCNPKEAIETFISSKIEILCIGNYFVKKVATNKS